MELIMPQSHTNAIRPGESLTPNPRMPQVEGNSNQPNSRVARMQPSNLVFLQGEIYVHYILVSHGCLSNWLLS
jgi:hypothetical protein